MKKSAMILMLAAGFAFAGCSNDDVAPVVGEGVEIALNSATVDASGALSRAPFAGAISSSNVLEARVVASTTSNFVGAAYANGIMKFNGGLAANYDATGLAGASVFPDAVNPVYLFGVYPAEWNIANGGQADFTFTGVEDVMATEKVSTTQTDVVNGAYKVLSFKHLLTRLVVKLSAAPAAVATIGDVTSVKLIGDKTTGTTAISNKVAIANNGAAMTSTFSSASATSLNFFALSVDASNARTYGNAAPAAYTLTTDPTFMAYSMVAPVTATSANKEEYFLEVNTTSGGIKRIPVDLKNAAANDFVGSTAGRSFVISLYFKSNKEIAVSAEVQDWVIEGEWQGEFPID